MPTKTCLGCGKRLDLSEFATNGRKRSGGQKHKPRCRSCTRGGPSDAREPSQIVYELASDREATRLRAENKKLAKALEQADRRAGIVSEISKRLKIAPAKRVPKSKREAAAVLLCSDWHIEEPVDPEKVNGLNEYSLDIADFRLDNLLGGLLWKLGMHQSGYHIDNLVLWLGGDLFSGHIHEELMEESQLSPVESVLWLQERICTIIETILHHTDVSITVPCCYGNHGRTTPKSRISTGAENSFEWLMYKQLESRYKSHDRVRIVAPRSQLVYLDVYGYKMRFHHGDSVRYGGGIGGLLVPLKKAISGWDKALPADITCIGHFHQLQFLPHAVTNGSLIGYGPYSVRIKAEYEPPQQAFFLVDRERGITCCSGVWV